MAGSAPASGHRTELGRPHRRPSSPPSRLRGHRCPFRRRISKRPVANDDAHHPAAHGRDRDDLDIVSAMARSGPASGVTCHQPARPPSVPVLPRGRRTRSPSAPRGYAEWRAVASEVTPVASHHYHDRCVAALQPGIHDRGERKRKRCDFLPAGNGLGYLTLFAGPGPEL